MIEKLEQREGEKCNVVMVTTITSEHFKSEVVGSSKNGRKESASGFFFFERIWGMCVFRERGGYLLTGSISSR